MPTESDIKLLAMLAEYHVLTITQLAILWGTSARAIRKRLNGLTDDGLVRMVPFDSGRPGRPERMVSLTPRAVDILRDRGEIDRSVSDEQVTAEQLRCLNHQVLINWFRMHLQGIEQVIPQISATFLSSTSPSQVDHEGSLLRDRAPVGDSSSPDVYFTPDGVFSLTHRELDKSLLFFLEVDMGTESLTSRRGDRRDVRQKILNYQAYFRSGRYKKYEDTFHARFNGFRLLFLTTTDTRLLALCRLASRMRPSNFIWFTVQGSMFEHGLAASIWKQPGRLKPPGQSILGPAFACPSPILPVKRRDAVCPRSIQRAAKTRHVGHEKTRGSTTPPRPGRGKEPIQ